MIAPFEDLAWRIRIRFAGKMGPREYLTPDVRGACPGWGDEIFVDRIRSLEFHLPTHHKILLAGMEQYNFFVEAIQRLHKVTAAEINAFWLCGKLPRSRIVDMWRIGGGTIVRQQRYWGQEWGGGPTRGWKPGTPAHESTSLLVGV